MEKCHYGKWSLWKMTCPCTTMESVTMENVTMESVTMEKDVVPNIAIIFAFNAQTIKRSSIRSIRCQGLSDGSQHDFYSTYLLATSFFYCLDVNVSGFNFLGFFIIFLATFF